MRYFMFFLLSLVIVAKASTIASWNFDQVDSWIAFDSSVNANHGTIVGDDDKAWLTNPNALWFDGGSVYITDIDTINHGGNFTMSVVLNNHATKNEIIFHSDEFELATVDGYISIHTAPNGAWAGQMSDTVTTTTLLPVDEWSNIVVTGSSDSIFVYFNGHLIQKMLGIPQTIFSNTRIGCIFLRKHFFGAIDEIVIYNEIKSNAEIFAYWNAHMNNDNLIAHWAFNKNDLLVIPDESENNNNIIPVGNFKWITDSINGVWFDGGSTYCSGYNGIPSFPIRNSTFTFTAIFNHQIEKDQIIFHNTSFEVAIVDNQISVHTTDSIQSGANLEQNKWYFIAITCTPDEMKFYQNGELIKTSHGVNISEIYQFRIGAIYLRKHFHGIIDEIKFYNDALSESDISSYWSNYNLYNPFIISDTTVIIEDILDTIKIKCVDNDSITWSIISKPDWLTTSSSNNILSFIGSPISDFNQYLPITISATDGKEIDTNTFYLWVNEINDDPTITSIPDTIVAENDTFSYDITLTDEENNANISYEFETAPINATIQNASIKWITTFDDAGINAFNIKIIDSTSLGKVTINHIFNVNVSNINRAPDIENNDTIVIMKPNEEINMSLIVHDLDQDPLDYMAESEMTVVNDSNDYTIKCDGKRGIDTTYLIVTDGNLFDSLKVIIIVDNATNIKNVNIPKVTFSNQNFPNPFKASTKIEYGLVKNTNVSINIFNSNGRLVETFSGSKSAGYHSYIWNASNMPTGIYFYRVQIGDYIKTKKMTLSK